MLFLAMEVCHQTCLDHDAIVLDTLGHKLKDGTRDLWLCFRYEACWMREIKAKKVIKKALNEDKGDVLSGIQKTRVQLESLQRHRYNSKKNWINCLVNKMIG